MKNESKRSLIEVEEEVEISDVFEERADTRKLQSASIVYPSLNPPLASPPPMLHSTKKVDPEKEAAASKTEKVKKDDVLSPNTYLLEASQSSLFINHNEQICSSGKVHVEPENLISKGRNHVTLAQTGSHKMNEMSSQSIFHDQHRTNTLPTTDLFIPTSAVPPQKEKLRCSTSEDLLSAEASPQPTSPKDADIDRETLVSTEKVPESKCSGAPFRDVSDVPKAKVLLLQGHQKVDPSAMGLADPTEAGAPGNEKNLDNNRGANLQKGICFS